MTTIPFFRRMRAGLPGLGGERKLPPRWVMSLLLAMFVTFFGYTLCKGKVVRVHDGDTLTVLREEDGLTRVRLYGVDAPESAQKGGMEAMRFLQDLASFQTMTLEEREKDRYGRAVAVLRLLDGRTLNEELIRAGHAWVYTAHCKEPICLKWRALERRAKAEGRGLWQSRHPQPPWQWRRMHMRNR